jgi:ATP-dependent RNA helicase RhlE
MPFQELGLMQPLLRAVADAGYTAPTPIQTKTIPTILAGRDVLGCAQTGTGKTGAFALPILHKLAETPSGTSPTPRNAGHGKRSNGRVDGNKGNKNRRRDSRPRALVLCPTRELATQIHDSFRDYGRHLPLRASAIFGGVGQVPQVRRLRAGVDIIVATPGRLLDLIGQGLIDLGAIEMLVLDEADRMLDMGFVNDIRKVIARLPESRQTLFFSATMPPEIKRLAASILREPTFVKVAPVSSTVDTIAQHVYHVGKRDKSTLLHRLLDREQMRRTLVFTRTKHGADKLVRNLRRGGVEAHAIHGNKSQTARTRALAAFKAGRTPVLVATDIASRGLDVDEITHVINFDMPGDAETYVHRIGRTARAGASGTALSFCDYEESTTLRAIERLIDQRLSVAKTDPDLALPALAPKPPKGGWGGRGSHKSGAPSGKRRAASGSASSPRGRRRSRSRRPRQAAR